MESPSDNENIVLTLQKPGNETAQYSAATGETLHIRLLDGTEQAVTTSCSKTSTEIRGVIIRNPQASGDQWKETEHIVDHYSLLQTASELKQQQAA